MKSKIKLIVIGLAANIVTGFAQKKVLEAAKVDERKTLPRVLLLIVVGGLSYMSMRELERKFEPSETTNPREMISDLTNQ